MTVAIYGSDIPLTGGAIQSAIDTKGKIASYKKNIEDLMSSVKNQVNTVMGKDFFVGDQAKDIQLNPEFAKDVSKMKISAETANKLAGITDGDYKEGLSYKQALDQFIVGVASDKSAVNAYQNIHKDLLEGIQQEKMSIEGVNMEEEMVNLMAFQKYFVANSKAITTMNEVFDSLFSIIR